MRKGLYVTNKERMGICHTMLNKVVAFGAVYVYWCIGIYGRFECSTAGGKIVLV